MKGLLRQTFNWFLGLMLVLANVGGPMGLLAPEAGAAPPTAAAPSDDIPVMRPGQQVARPAGVVQITTFARSDDEKASTFTIEFLLTNRSQAVLNTVVSSRHFFFMVPHRDHVSGMMSPPPHG